MSHPLVTRFAPSPTGHLHIGGARTALFCWAFARKNAGRFMIRIEDTDQARSSDESAKGILDDLAWLGITWDDGPTLRTPHGDIGAGSRPVGPFFQAQRVHLYNSYLAHLMNLGRAYPAFETSEELDAARKAAAAKKATFKYQRPADVQPGVAPRDRMARAAAGEPHVIRFVMPPTPVVVHDQVLGEVTFAAGEVDDFVIRKADGFPTYHFAVVIDDELMGVTHVLRAQEHLMNTPRHVAMQQALTRLDTFAPFSTPVYAHMPLIFNMDGTKMSKRDKAKAARNFIYHVGKALADKDPELATNKAAAAFGLDPVKLEDAIERSVKLRKLYLSTNMDERVLEQFLNKENDDTAVAEAIANYFGLKLPEIEVWDFRRNGYLPEAITNFIALLGWSPGVKLPDGKDLEKFDMSFLAANFSIDRIGKTNARFDRVKLASFNADAIAALSDDEFQRRLLGWADAHNATFAAQWRAIPDARRAALGRMAKPRCKTLADAPKVLAFALVADGELVHDPAAVAKYLGPASAPLPGRAVLAAFIDFIAAGPSDPAAIDAWIKQRADSTGLKIGDVAQPIRIAVAGSTVSPPLGEVVFTLGPQSTLARIHKVL